MKTLTVIMLTILSMITISILPCYANDNVINACIQKVNGQLRIVANRNDCKPSEDPISWSIGPGYVNTASAFDVSVKSKNINYLSVRCDGNDYVTGCSYSLNGYQGDMSDFHFVKVMPDVCGPNDICHGCRIGLYNSSSVDLEASYSVFAYCSNAP